MAVLIAVSAVVAVQAMIYEMGTLLDKINGFV